MPALYLRRRTTFALNSIGHRNILPKRGRVCRRPSSLLGDGPLPLLAVELRNKHTQRNTHRQITVTPQFGSGCTAAHLHGRLGKLAGEDLAAGRGLLA